MISERNPQISIVVAAHNEAEHIGFIDEVLKNESGAVGEILIMEDRSTDGTLEECLGLEKKYQNVKIFQNESGLNLNQMIMFLLERVKTKYVHIRSPHDFYFDGFYRFHLNRLTSQPHIQVSTNKCKNSNFSIEFEMERLDLSHFWTNFYNRILDHSISSCGFVAEIQPIQSVWKKYINFEKYTDWLVKKELSHFYRSVHSFKILSFYNNDIKKEEVLAKDNFWSAEKTKLLEMTHKNFWEFENRNYVTFPEHEIGIIDAFCCLKSKQIKLNWLIAFTLTACLYTLKRMTRFFIHNR